MNTIIDGIKYSLENGEATIIKQEESLSGDIVIPATVIDGNGVSYTVTNVSESAFASTRIASITMPSTLKSLGTGCFRATGLSSVNLSATSIMSLPNSCFESCSSLSLIFLPDCIKSFGNSCFEGCSKLVVVSLPYRNIKEDEELLWEYYELGTFTLPYGIGSLGTNCFRGCSNLTTVRLPNSITELGAGCFAECTSLAILDLPDNIKSLPDRCFLYCTNLNSIFLPDSITSLGEACFWECSSLAAIDLPDGITSLGNSCFSSCYSLEAIHLPNNITSLGKCCFGNCTRLFKIICSWNDLGKIRTGENIFAEIYSECKLYIPRDTKFLYEEKDPWSSFKHIIECGKITTIDGIDYSLENGEATIIQQGKSLSGAIVIPRTVTYNGRHYAVTSMMERAFAERDYADTHITSIKLPDSIISLGNYCFHGCTALTTITLPGTLTSLPNYCFCGCWELSSITLPDGITSLGDECFSHCFKLESINLPNSITSLGKGCFAFCESLDYITLPNSVISLGDQCFRGCHNLYYIDLGDNVTSLGDECFYNDFVWHNTKSISLPKSIISIGEKCFGGCYSLSKITCEWTYLDKVIIGSDVFKEICQECVLYVPENTKSMYEETTPWCNFKKIIELGAESINIDSIKYTLQNGEATILEQTASLSSDIVIPETVTYNGRIYPIRNVTEEAFAEQMITSIKLPSTLTSLRNGCFMRCSRLKSINLPDSVTSLGDYCFGRCYGLSEIICGWTTLENVTIGYDVFDGINPNCVLYVPKGAKSVYEGTEPWSSFKHIIELDY